MVNNSLIEIGDRIRDISTFRVLGYRPRQVAGIFLRQNLIIFAVGLILAFPIGYGLVVGLVIAYDTELFRMPIVVQPRALVGTALISVAFVLIAQWVVYRQIHKLDWLEGVKVKE
jgi:putative ABC transport system permease protein